MSESLTRESAPPGPPPAAAPASPSLMHRLFTLRESPPAPIKRLVGVAGVGLAVLVWWALTLGATPETRIVSPVVLPSPGEVLQEHPDAIHRACADRRARQRRCSA